MSNVGNILYEARKKKGVDLAQVELETNIEKSYIEALEKEDYKKIPAEAYIIGFLRNYSEYLGLDPNEIIRQYKNVKIEVVEVPQEILIPKKKSPVIKIALLIFLAIFIISVVYLGLMLFLGYVSGKSDSDNKKILKKEMVANRVSEEYEIRQDVQFDKEIFKGDKIKANIEEQDYIITVLSTYPVLKLGIQDKGERIIEPSETTSFDLDDDGVIDIEVTAKTIAKNDDAPVSVFIASGADVGKDRTLEASVDGNVVASPDRQKKNEKTYFTGAQAYPILLNVEFTGYCFFRVDIDKQTRIERFYGKGERLDTIRAQNGFRMWASNGFAIKCKLNGGGVEKDLGVMGRAGEVIVKDFKWVQGERTRKGEFYFVETDVD